MPSSPIAKEVILPDNWVHLQKTMIPDSNTCCYFSVWYDANSSGRDIFGKKYDICNERKQYVRIKGTAWLMWCPFDEDPTINDNWGHVEDLSGDVKNVVTAIEAIYGVSFHESIWKEIPSE